MRPEKLNAIDASIVQGLLDAADAVAEQSDVRAVVLSGEGRAFCAGLDLERLHAEKPLDDFAHVTLRDGAANIYQHVALRWRSVPVPVIAAVHGVAVGAGLQLMLGTDIRYVTADAKLGFLELSWGIIPDMAGFVFMRSAPRPDLAAELTYTGRLFDGHEAFAAGFATRILEDPYAAALATAREIASRNPDAVRAAKRMFRISPMEPDASVLRAEAREQAAISRTPNQREAVAAKRERRPAAFSDPAR